MGFPFLRAMTAPASRWQPLERVAARPVSELSRPPLENLNVVNILHENRSVLRRVDGRQLRPIRSYLPSPIEQEQELPLGIRLQREWRRGGQTAGLSDRLLEIGAHCAALPDFDTRRPDAIIGYGGTGLWR
jgi:hypothetical protein